MRRLASCRKGKGGDRVICKAVNSLVTEQEEQVEEAVVDESLTAQPRYIEKPILMYTEEEEEAEISVQELKKSDAEKMSVLVGQLLAKNKISAKNAFEVPLIHLNQTYAFVCKMEEYIESSSDNSWKRLSSTLESNNKIYGYRVDATHSETYKVLESISRQEKKMDEGRVGTSLRQEREEYFLQGLDEDQQHSALTDCLEKNLRNINILHLDTFFNVNPVLEKTKRIFDQNGTRTLLLNCLEISPDLCLTITLVSQQSHEAPAESEIQLLSPEMLDGSLAGKNIFRQIESVCVVNDLLSKEDEGTKHESGEIEEMWREFDCIQQGKVGSKRIEQIDKEKKIDHSMNENVEEINNPQTIVPCLNSQQEMQVHLPPQPQQPDLLQPENQPKEILDLPVQLLPLPTNSSVSEEVSSRQVSNIQLSNSQRQAKKLYSTDIILREINEKYEQDFPLKNIKIEGSQVKREPRKKRQRIQPNIQFLCQDEEITPEKRQRIFRINKSKKKQFKKLLKSLGIDAYVEKNIVIDLKSKTNFQLKTLLSNFCDKLAEDHLLVSGEDSRQLIDLEFFTAKSRLMKNGRNTIHQAKQSIKQLIEASKSSKVSFIDIYEQIMELQGYISPALCFLTILHLANEQNYSLFQHQGEYNYIINTQPTLD